MPLWHPTEADGRSLTAAAGAARSAAPFLHCPGRAARIPLSVPGSAGHYPGTARPPAC